MTSQHHKCISYMQHNKINSPLLNHPEDELLFASYAVFSIIYHITIQASSSLPTTTIGMIQTPTVFGLGSNFMIWSLVACDRELKASREGGPPMKFTPGISAWRILGKSVYTDFPRSPTRSHLLDDQSCNRDRSRYIFIFLRHSALLTFPYFLHKSQNYTSCSFSFPQCSKH